jgi:DNA adenine methylase
MKYMGGKSSYAKDIVRIATAERKKNQAWVETMVGGGNVIVQVPQKDGPRVGNDINWRMVALLDGLGNRGWQPPEHTITEEEYNKIKQDPDSYEPELVAFVATGMTFGSVWLSTFARDGEGKRDYCRETRDFALKDAPFLKGVKFYSMRYEEFTPLIPPESIVYCDPPYAGTTGYGGAKTDIKIGQSLSLNTWNRAAFLEVG